MGSCFGIALSLVIFAGSELFTGNNMVFAISSLEKRVGFGPIIMLFVMSFVLILAGICHSHSIVYMIYGYTLCGSFSVVFSADSLLNRL